MAFIPGYEYDIFISYAHVDNIAFPGQADGWIEQFYKNLNLMLAKRFGRLDMIKIWWDNKKLDGSKLFDHSIEEGIKKSAIMICLNSPGYLQSAYCKQELDLFYSKVQLENAGLKVGERSRIINVLLNNIPFSEWPSGLTGTSGFHFHDAKEPFDFGETVETLTQEFKIQMQKLRDAVWNMLNEFHTSHKTNLALPEKNDVNAITDFTVFLGEVPDTLRTSRKRVVNELEKKGFTVVTGIPPPDEATAHENAVNAALQKSKLSIHMMDEYPGKEIEGFHEIWYPQKQTELALQSPNPQMIWIPADTDFENIEEEKYSEFLKEIEKGKVCAKEYEFLRGSKSTVSQDVIDFAEQMKANQIQQPAIKERMAVLLDTHFSDQMYALDLSKTLLENHILPFINPQEDDPRKNINLLGDRMSQVKKLIFLYGSVSREWVLERMSAALQLIISNNYPIEDFFIYMAPPFKESSDIMLRQKFLKVNIVDNSRNQIMDKGTLQKFLNDLKIDSV
jgi:hypothetical protein